MMPHKYDINNDWVPGNRGTNEHDALGHGWGGAQPSLAMIGV